MKSTNKKRNDISIVPACLVGISVSWAITIILLCIGAIFIINEYIDTGVSGLVATLIVFLSVAIACYITKMADQNNSITNVFIVCGSYILSLVICGLLFFDGIKGNLIFGVLSAALGALLAIFVGNKGKRTTKRRKRRVGSS